MDYETIKSLWEQGVSDLLDVELSEEIINVLSLQTIDSIRRITIYDTYAIKARQAEGSSLSYFHTSNPFILSQRDSLPLNSRVWYIYLATYFGKSNKSKWKLFNNAAFRKDKTLIELDHILNNRQNYYEYLRSLDFFAESNFSNHRKYTKKALDGEGGVLNSMEYFLDNMDHFTHANSVEFDFIYKRALLIPNFGRMAAFDFTASLSKCNLNVDAPVSMYHQSSTGPLRALKHILILSGAESTNRKAQVELGDKLLQWFINNSDIPMIAQVIEDAICNWQKSPTRHVKYFG